MANPIRIVQLSDTHFLEEGATPEGGHSYDTDAAYEAVLAYMGDHSDLDMVVVTGDVADHGRAAQYRKASAAFARLEVPVNICPGNHDFVDAFQAGVGTIHRTFRFPCAMTKNTPGIGLRFWMSMRSFVDLVVGTPTSLTSTRLPVGQSLSPRPSRTTSASILRHGCRRAIDPMSSHPMAQSRVRYIWLMTSGGPESLSAGP